MQLSRLTHSHSHNSDMSTPQEAADALNHLNGAAIMSVS